MKRTVQLLSAVVLVALGGASYAQSTAPVPKAVTPPAFTPVRWNENYSYLKNVSGKADPFDPIKYIPLNEKGDVYLSLGGQVRERYELINGQNFSGVPDDNDGYYLTRLLAHAVLHIGQNFRTFVQGKSAMIDDRVGGLRPSDSDEMDIQQAFFDVRLPFSNKDSFTLRTGRQDLIYGAQRLISPLDWTNVRRTFEGVKGSFVLTQSNQTLDFFWVRPIIVNNEQLNDGDGDQSFAGVYHTIGLPGTFGKAANTKLELYGFALNQQRNDLRTTDADIYTVGTRFSSAPKPFDVDVELDYQFGQAGIGDISAWSVATEAGYTFVDVTLTPRLFAGFDAASGDSDPTNPDRGTFNQLFPLGHLYFGYIDVVGRQNIVDVHPGVDLTLLSNAKYAKKLALRGEFHAFWRQNNSDALYNASGAVQRSAGASDAAFVGNEVDLLLTWQIDRHLSAYVGYSHFFAGDFLQETGPSEDIDFVYVAVSYTF